MQVIHGRGCDCITAAIRMRSNKTSIDVLSLLAHSRIMLNLSAQHSELVVFYDLRRFTV
jgi:hypothetical protein